MKKRRVLLNKIHAVGNGEQNARVGRVVQAGRGRLHVVVNVVVEALEVVDDALILVVGVVAVEVVLFALEYVENVRIHVVGQLVAQLIAVASVVAGGSVSSAVAVAVAVDVARGRVERRRGRRGRRGDLVVGVDGNWRLVMRVGRGRNRVAGT